VRLQSSSTCGHAPCLSTATRAQPSARLTPRPPPSPVEAAGVPTDRGFQLEPAQLGGCARSGAWCGLGAPAGLVGALKGPGRFRGASWPSWAGRVPPAGPTTLKGSTRLWIRQGVDGTHTERMHGLGGGGW